MLCDNGTLPIVQFLKSRYWGKDKKIESYLYRKKGNDNEKRDTNLGKN